MALPGDCYHLCLKMKCHVQHRLRECPELQNIGQNARRDLLRAYNRDYYGVARQVIEKAVGCRLCRAQGHWYVPIPMALASASSGADTYRMCHAQGR